jgi:nicotinamide-nucleotide amidase
MLFPSGYVELASAVITGCTERGWQLATAESCTGGLIAACLTEVPGASKVLDRGYVVYANRAKHGLLDVPEALLVELGAVSEPVARKMAEGARVHAETALAIAVTGVAGPGGGTKEKPVGLVHLALAHEGGTEHRELRLKGDRKAIRLETVRHALELLRTRLD